MNQTYDTEHKVIYSGYNYDKVYIPVFLKYNKAKLPHYRFIKTINAGSSNAHILQRGNEYFMCMSNDENISAEEQTMEPMGFKRRYIDELQKLADVLCTLHKSETKKTYSIINRRTASTVTPPVINEKEHWSIKMMNHYIINLKTKEEVHLAENKGDICKQCGLTIHLLNIMIRDGICGRDWCYKGTRVDGLTWEQYFSSRGVAVCSQTPLHHSPP